MNIVNAQSPSILSGRKLSAVRTGWWILFLVFALFRVFSIWYSSIYYNKNTFDIYANILNVVILIVSTALALVLFIKKSNDWTAITATIMFLTWQTDSMFFWAWVVNRGWFNTTDIAYIREAQLASVLSLPFDCFVYLVVMGVFMTFPTGHWISSGSRRIFQIMALFFALFILCAPLMLLLGNALAVSIILVSFRSLMLVIIELIAGYLLFRHFLGMQNSLQRQQIKWIVVFFLLLACVYAVLVPSVLFLIFFVDPSAGWNLVAVTKLVVGMINLGLFGAFSIAIFRFRLWDVEIFINKTLVYSGLTAMLGLLAVVSTTLIDYGMKLWLGNSESSIWAALFSALPVAAAFRPFQELIQKWVDRYFKPEEVNFSDTFIEFTPPMRDWLNTSQIIEIVSKQVAKQLGVEFARIYLAQTADWSYLVRDTLSTEKSSSPLLKEKQLAQLQAGELLINDSAIPYSLLVPLVVPRACVPDFLGVIMLGRRTNGKGYSTQILDSLKTLGADTGKVLYLSQASEQAKQKAIAQ